MNSPSLRGLIRAFIVDKFSAGETLRTTEIAEEFVTGHCDEIADNADRMARQFVAAEIKRLAGARPDEDGQFSLFPGLPTALTISPGVVKPIDSCTWEDLIGPGRGERVENIANAEKALARYDEDCDLLRPHLAGTDRTVGDVRHLIDRDGIS